MPKPSCQVDFGPYLQRWVAVSIHGRILSHRGKCHLSVQLKVLIEDGYAQEICVLSNVLRTEWNLTHSQARKRTQAFKRSWFAKRWTVESARNKRDWRGKFRLDNATAHEILDWSLRLGHDLTVFVDGDVSSVNA